MKSIRRRLAAAVLSLAVVLSMMPAAAFTAWADESEKDIVAEETSNETVGNDQEGDLQLEGEEEALPESKKTMKAATTSTRSVPLGTDVELDSLVVGYTNNQAAANTCTITFKNTGDSAVTIDPDKLSFSNTKFKWTKLINASQEIQADGEVDVAKVEPKVGLAADWYYGFVNYRDYNQGIYSSTMVYLAILKDGLSLDVYDNDDEDITLFDLGSSIIGSSKTVSQDFWVTNDGNKEFSLSFTSTNDLFQVSSAKTSNIQSDEDVLCNIKVDPDKLGNLDVGTYTGNVTARATDSDNKVAEETIPVTYRVTEKPKWATSEASETMEVGSYAYSTQVYIDNISAFKNEEEDYLRATLIEGSDHFKMSDYIYSDGYTYIQSKEAFPGEGVYEAKIVLQYDPTGQGDFSNPVDLGTMDFTLRVVPEGTYQLSLVNKEYDKEKEVLDLGVLYTGYTEKDAEDLGTTLRFKNTGIGDLDVSGKDFGAYYSENGEDFVWTEDAESATLKPLDEYDEISIRPQTGKKPGVYYDYFYIRDDKSICYTEFIVRYLVVNKGQNMRIVDSGGLFDEPKDIAKGDSVIYDSTYVGADEKKYYKWIDIYNTGDASFWLSMPSADTCGGIYEFTNVPTGESGDAPIEVKPGGYKMLRIVLDTKNIDRDQAHTYDGEFTVKISDEKGKNSETRTVPVSYTVTDTQYRVSLDLQGKGVYEKKKVEADFPEGTTYKSAITQLNKEIVGDTSNLWPVDNEYTVVAFTKNKDGAYSSWDEVIEAQKQVSNQVIAEDTDLYVNWAKKILTADVTAEIPAGGTTAGTAIKASVDKDAPYSIYEVSWKDMNDKDVLECNDAYPLEVKLDADFGYAFSVDSSVRINGVYATRTSAANTVSHATANRRIMIGHDWDEGKVTKEATADSEGVMTFTCKHCKKTKTEVIPKVDISKGTKHKTSAGTVTIISKKNKTAAFVKPKSNKKKVTVPATVKVGGKTFKITAIDARAFKGKKTTTLIVKTKKLTKKSVKGSLKGSMIKTVKVKVGKKKVNKQYIKKYKKIFTKKNVGKKVKVK